MQKLVLVDEFDREYKRLQRPAAAVAKTDHSLRLSDALRNAAADDRGTAQIFKRRQTTDTVSTENQLDKRTAAANAWIVDTRTAAKKEEGEKKYSTDQTRVGSVWTVGTPILERQVVPAACSRGNDIAIVRRTK